MPCVSNDDRDNAVSSYGLETVGKMLRIMDDSPKLGAIASQVCATPADQAYVLETGGPTSV